MPCPHSSSWSADPSTCSQCLGAGARVVRSDGRGVTVDGVPVRDGLLGTPVPAPSARTAAIPGQPREARPASAPAPRRTSPRRPTSGNTTAWAAITNEDDAFAGAVKSRTSARVAIVHDDDTFSGTATTTTTEDQSVFLTAEDLIDFGARYATLAVPTPAGREAVALLETFALCEEDAYLVALHRAGQIRLVSIENVLAVEASLHRRGWRTPSLREVVIMDGRAYHGIAVTATRARVEDFAEFAEQVVSDHECNRSPLLAFVSHAFKIATVKGSPDEALIREARRFLAEEWDRIRGVLAEQPIDHEPLPAPPEMPGLSPAFAQLLRQLCDRLRQPKQRGPGRRRLLIGDVAFAVVMMVATGATGRRAASELVAFYGAGFLSRPLHYNSIFRGMKDQKTKRALAELARVSGAMLSAQPPEAPASPRRSLGRARLPRTEATAKLAQIVCQNLRQITATSGNPDATPPLPNTA